MKYQLQYWDARTFKWLNTGLSVDADTRVNAFEIARKHQDYGFWQWNNLRIVEVS